MAWRLKRSNCPKLFFSRKITNTISMYLLALFILQNFLKILRAYPELWCAFSGPKWPIWPEQTFLVQTIIITFIYLLALFTVQNFKIFLQEIQSYEEVPFLGSKWSICLPPPRPLQKKKFILIQTIIITCLCLLVLFIV